MSRREPLKPYIFRVIRQKIDGVTVRVLLEPYTDLQRVNISARVTSFITGGLSVDPWSEGLCPSGDELNWSDDE